MRTTILALVQLRALPRATPQPALRATLPTRGGGIQRTPCLTEFDLVGARGGEVDAAEGENHFGRQLLVALEAAARDRVAHRLLDLALRGDADLLQKSTQAGVENDFVHDALPRLRPYRIVQHIIAG